MRIFSSLALAFAIIAPASSVRAQTPDGDTVFAQHCAVCHEHPTPENKAPPREALATLGPDAIFASLTEGNMRIQGQPLTPDERIAVAERFARPPGRPAAGPERTDIGSVRQRRRPTCTSADHGLERLGPRRAQHPLPGADAGGITAANVAQPPAQVGVRHRRTRRSRARSPP